MTTAGRWLIDKSAAVRIGSSQDSELWAERITRGLVCITSVTILEIGYSARSADHWSATVEQPPVALMPVITLNPTIEHRAIELQGLLARQGHHRAPSVADLLIAAAAELEGITVLHVDKDFELIASVTGQPVERLRSS